MMKSDSDSEESPNKEIRQQTQDVKPSKYDSFQQFKLKKELILGLCQLGYKLPTPVQQQSIPLILQGKSIIARAKNGTGKTGAFLIPILNQINQNSSAVQALILVPTRQLALQIHALANQIIQFMKLKVGLLIGGNNTNEDLTKLDQNMHLIIGTTGRVKEIIRRRPGLLNDCRFFVLDEADKLLSTDFQIQIEQMLEKIKNPQILLYSATFPITIRPFKQKWLPKAEVLNLMDELMLIGLTHYYILVDQKDKIKALNTIYSKLIIHQCIIFCGSFTRVQMLSKKLREKGYQNLFLHSKMSPLERTKVFNKFKTGQVKTLVSSDLCARGIDVQSVNVVINFDFPSTSDTYLHRIGRSGRFGQIGLAINLITQKDQNNVIKIEKQLDTQIDALPNQVDPSIYT